MRGGSEKNRNELLLADSYFELVIAFVALLVVIMAIIASNTFILITTGKWGGD